MAVSGTLAFGVSLGLAFGGAVYWDPVSSYQYSSAEGALLLRQKDYTVVGGGARDYKAKDCGSWAMTRRYDVEKDGVRETGKIVCFSDILGAHLPR